jgi:S1-C subfamily serine protease
VKTNVERGSPSAQDELLRRFFGFEGRRDGDREVEGAGSVSSSTLNGYILTNHHVVANADEITVTLLENRSLIARVVGSTKARISRC